MAKAKQKKKTDTISTEAMKWSLNQRQFDFCNDFIRTNEQKQSAINVGYSEKTASQQASRMLTNVNVQNYLEHLREKMKSEAIADGQQVLEFLTRVMKGEEKEREFLINNDEAMVKEKDPQMRDRLKSAELLGKHLSLFTEKQETAAPVVVNIDTTGMFKKNEEGET